MTVADKDVSVAYANFYRIADGKIAGELVPDGQPWSCGAVKDEAGVG